MVGMVVLLIILNAALGFIIGSLTGGYIERRKWNRLIEDGKLPRPSPKLAPRKTGWYEHWIKLRG